MESPFQRERSYDPGDDRPIKILVFAFSVILVVAWAVLLLYFANFQCDGVHDEKAGFNGDGIWLFFKAIIPHTEACCPLSSTGTCSMWFIFLVVNTMFVSPCTIAGGMADWSWRLYPDAMEDLRAKSIVLLFTAAAVSIILVATAILVGNSGAKKTSGFTWYIAAGLTIGNWACLFLAGARGQTGLLGGPDTSSEDEATNKQALKGGKAGKGFPPGGKPGFPPGGKPGFPPGGPGFPPGSKGGPPMGGPGFKGGPPMSGPGGKPGGPSGAAPGFPPGGLPQSGGPSAPPGSSAASFSGPQQFQPPGSQ